MALSPEYFRFFDELAQNNHKAWFDQNRSRYEKEVKAPFVDMISQLAQRIEKHQPGLGINPAKTLFRINRDIRFSKDKRPYKEHLGSYFTSVAGSKEGPGFYVGLGHDQLFIGGGAYELDKDSLAAVRQEIFYNLEEFKSIVYEPTLVKLYGTVQGERNKIIPAEYKELAAEFPLIANKQFYIGVESLTQADVLAADFIDRLETYWLTARPLTEFLQRALTPVED